MKTHKTHDAIILGAIIPDGDNGKSQFYIATTNDGYHDLRLSLDVDDCDAAFARAWMKRIIACVEAQRGREKIVSAMDDPEYAEMINKMHKLHVRRARQQ